MSVAMSMPASSVTPQVLPMIWRERIPAATLSVIAGKPGLGKSTLGMTIAAELSRAGLAVLISNLEDDFASVLRPRLEVAGADLDRVHLVPPISAPVLPRDIGWLSDLITELGAACLLLDPFAAHFRLERHAHDRPTLYQLARVARETRCAMIAVHHTTKASGGQAIDLIGGPSGGLAGSARAVYIYGYDPDDEDRRALACVKVNGVDQPPTLILEHETVEYDGGHALIEAGRLRIVDEINAEAKKVLSRGRSHRNRDAECVAWLTHFLADGDDCKRRTQEVRTEGKAAGWGWQTLLRAGVALRVEKVRIGWGGDGFWLWRLPDEHPLRNQDVAEPAAVAA